MDVANFKLFGILPLLACIPLLPLAGALFNLVLGRWIPRWLVNLVACGTVIAACALSVLELREQSVSLATIRAPAGRAPASVFHFC